MSKDEAINLIKKYKWNSLFMRYFKKFVIIIFVPFLILTSLIFMLYKSNTSIFISHNISNDYRILHDSLNSALAETNTLIEFQASTPSVSRFVYAKSIDFSSEQTVTNLETISSLMSTFISASHNIENITLYSYTNDYVYSYNGGCMKLDKFYNRDLIKEIIESNNNNLSYITLLPNKNSKHINVVNVINSPNNPHSIFVVTLDFNKILAQHSSATIDNIFVLKGNQIIYSNKTNYSDEDLIKKVNSSVVYSENTKNVNLSNKALSSKLAHDLTLAVTFIPSYYSSYISQIVLILVLCTILSIALPILLSFYFSMKYYSSISKITYQVQHIATDSSYNENLNEINYITNNITRMSNRLKDAEDTLTEKLITLEKFKIQAMQNQINPHFIFNTLNSIGLYIQNYFEDDSDVIVMLSSLSDMIAELISASSYMTSVENEIEYAKKYITIEQIKHMNTFDVYWDIDERVLKCQTVKMILQPIIENALNHGIYPLLDVKQTYIKVSAKKTGSDIEFIIEDNGSGFTPDKLNIISRQLADGDLPQTKHIGLLNVNFRLKTIYRNNYGVSAESSNGCTKVCILIPYSEQE